MGTPKWAPISRIVSIIIIIVVGTYIWKMAFGWSLNETYKFSVEVFGANYAKAASWIFQLGPQMFFLMAELAGASRPRMRWIFIGVALALNVVDTATNVSAFNIGVQDGTYIADLRPELRPVGLGMGYMACFAITWGEELLVLCVGAAFHLIGVVWYDFTKKSPPSWFLVDGISSIALAASGASAAGVTSYGNAGGGSRGRGGNNGKRSSRPKRSSNPGGPTEEDIEAMMGR